MSNTNRLHTDKFTVKHLDTANIYCETAENKLRLCKLQSTTTMYVEFYVLYTMHLGIILVNNQLDAQFFYVYFKSPHVSSIRALIIRGVNCINAISGICHSMWVTVLYAGFDGMELHAVPSKPAYRTVTHIE